MSKKYQIVMPSYLKGIRYVWGGGKMPCLLATYCRGIMTTFGDRPGIMETEYLDENSNKMDYIKTGRKLNPGQSQDQSSTLTVGGHDAENHSDMDLLCVAMRGRNPQNPSDRTKGCLTEQRLEINPSGKTNCLTTVQKDNLLIQLGRGRNKGGLFDSKTPTLTSCSWHNNHFLMEQKDANSRIKGITIKENGIRPHQGDDKKSGISELGTILFEETKTGTLTTVPSLSFLKSGENRKI